MTAKTLTYFVSYSRADQIFALRLAEQLRAEGVNLWIDQLDIAAGERWDRAVEEALETAQGLLVLLSRTSVESENVLDEVSYALSEQRRVIPVLFENCEIPFRLRRLQYIDLTDDYNQGFAKLLRNLAVEVNTNEAVHHRNTEEPLQAYTKKNPFRKSPLIAGLIGILFVLGGGAIWWASRPLTEPTPSVADNPPKPPEKTLPSTLDEPVPPDNSSEPSPKETLPADAPSEPTTLPRSSQPISLQYYQRKVDPSTLRSFLQSDSAGDAFDVSFQLSDLTDTPTNAIWFGPQVPVSKIQFLARGLIESGVGVQIIERKDDWPSEKAFLVQLGGSSRGKNSCSSDWTVAGVEDTTEFPIADGNAPTSGCAKP